MESAVEAAIGDLSAGLKKQLRQALEAELASRRSELDRRESAIRERELALDAREQELQVREQALIRAPEQPALKEHVDHEAPAQSEGQNPQAPPTTASRQVETAPAAGAGGSGSLFSPDVLAKPGSLFAPAVEASKPPVQQARVPAESTPSAAAPSPVPQEAPPPAAAPAPLAVLQKRLSLSRSLEADEEASTETGAPMGQAQASTAQSEAPKTGGLQWVSKPADDPAPSGGAAAKGLFGEAAAQRSEAAEAAPVAAPAAAAEEEEPPAAVVAQGHAVGMKSIFEEKAREARKSASAPDSRIGWKQVNNQLPLPSNQGTAPFRAHEAPFKKAQTTLVGGKAPPPRRSMQELLRADEAQRGA